MCYILALAPEITAAATVVMAVMAVAALAVQFWASPKPLDAKFAILRTCTEISCLLALISGLVLIIAGAPALFAILLASYVLLAQSILFVTTGGYMNRYQVAAYVMGMSAAILLAVSSVTNFVEAQVKDVRQLQDGTIKVLEEMVKVLRSGSPPGPSPSPVAR